MKKTENKIKVIYLAGVSHNGSSIISSFMGGYLPAHHTGELKFFHRVQTWPTKISCGCGQEINNCSFWQEEFKKSYKVFELPSIFSRIITSLKIFLGLNLNLQKKIKNSDEKKVFKDILLNTSVQFQGYSLIDSSKSLWRLIYLIKTEGIRVDVVYIKREMGANIFSLMKHDHGFIHAIFKYVVGNYLFKKFTRKYKNKVSVVETSHKEFCDNPLSFLEKIKDNFNMEFCEQGKGGDFEHVFSGNQNALARFRREGYRVYYDQSWTQNLNKTQKWLIRLIEKGFGDRI